jgi:hypothetical protein
MMLALVISLISFAVSCLSLVASSILQVQIKQLEETMEGGINKNDFTSSKNV